MSNNIQPKYGIVAILDALGARSFEMDHAKKFIEKRNNMLKDMALPLKAMHWQVNEDFEVTSEPIVSTFGDTIILTWDIPNEAHERILSHTGAWLSLLIAKGMACGIALRGSLAIGEFLQEGSTILGPAVSDAASWYDKTSWLGVIATPACGILLSREAEKSDSAIPNVFVQYHVPLTAGTNPNMWSEMWVVSWPANIVWHTKTYPKPPGITPRDALLNYLSQFRIPFGTEDKYANTISFFDWVIKNKMPRGL